MKPILELKNLSIVFGSSPTKAQVLLKQVPSLSKEDIAAATGQVVAVRDVDLCFFPGEIFVLMGPSGSGKSTLLRTLNGLIAPTVGQIHLQHEDQHINLLNLADRQLRFLRQKRFAMVFQHFGLMPWRTVAENVAFGLEGRKIPLEQQKEKIREVLNLVNLSSWAHKYPHQLSGGMQQRVGLARCALVTDADILLMDEPFSALDPIIRYELQNMLINLQKQLHKTIIFVGHDFDEAIRIGHRLGIMQDGRLLKVGTPRELMQEGEVGRSVATMQLEDQPVVLTNKEGDYWGVVNGPEIFKRILSTSPSPSPGKLL